MSFRQGKSLVDIPAPAAQLRTRKPPADLDHHLPIEGCLVLQQLPEPPQPQLTYRLGETTVLQHPRNIKVLNEDDVVLGKESVHDAVEVSLPPCGDTFVSLGQLSPGLLPVRRAPPLPTQVFVEFPYPPLRRLEGMDVLEHRPVGGDGKILHAKVNTHGVTGVAEFPKFVGILEVDKDRQFVLPRLGFRQGRRTNPASVILQPPERQVRTPEPHVPERFGEGDVPCAEGVGLRNRLKRERDLVHVLLGFEPRETRLMLEEVAIRRDEVAYGLFNHFCVRVLQPRGVWVLAHHRVIVMGQIAEGKIVPVLIVLLGLEGKESIVDIP